MKINQISFFLGLILISLNISDLRASHFSAGEVYYKWAPTLNDSNRYEVFVNWFRNNGGASMSMTSQNVCISSSCFGDTTISLTRIMPPPGMASPNDNNGGWIVSGIDDCANPNDPSYKDLSIHKFSGFVSLPGVCYDFKFTVNAQCCRDASDNLAASPNIYIEALLNNTSGPSSSPEIIDHPGIGFCVQNANAPLVQFQQEAIDNENDSIYYRLVQPESGVNCGPGVKIPYDSGYTAANPIASWNGLSIDQTEGIFSLKPRQQGAYVVKIQVENYRFIPMNLTWQNIGYSTREIMIPVTANCNYPASQAASLALEPGTFQPRNFSSQSMDSLQQAYQLSTVFKDSLNMVAELPSQPCFSRRVNLFFDNPIRINSIDETDFRLIAPDSSLSPIIGVLDTSGNSLFTSHISLQLLNPLVQDGNYILQVRNGNDGNTLIGKCGNTYEEFSVIILPISGCPTPEYEIEQLSVVGDSNIAVQWRANSALQDSGLRQNFGGWDLYLRENQGPWFLEHSTNQPDDSSHTLSFNGSRYPVDHNSYDFYLDLRYGGENWGSSSLAQAILLEEVSVQKDSLADYMQLSWNHYEAIPANRRAYLVEYGYYYQVDSVIWQSPTQTNTNSLNLQILKAANISRYAIRVRAIDGQNDYPSAQSNWIIYSPDDPISLEEYAAHEWLIPNILNPNGNGLNEQFLIGYQGSGKMPDFSLEVYNINGQLVFQDQNYRERNHASSAWSGKQSNGQVLAEGIYLYLIQFKEAGAESSVQMSGRLSIVH